jgi:TatA/E family protein of Tat protein translocase
MFGEIGFDKLLLLLVVFLLLFGAKRIPEIGRSLGKGIREFKGSLAGLDEPLESVRLGGADDSRTLGRSLPLAGLDADAVARETQAVRRLGS